jgi:hypothetical protein
LGNITCGANDVTVLNGSNDDKEEEDVAFRLVVLASTNTVPFLVFLRVVFVLVFAAVGGTWWDEVEEVAAALSIS